MTLLSSFGATGLRGHQGQGVILVLVRCSLRRFRGPRRPRIQLRVLLPQPLLIDVACMQKLSKSCGRF